MMMMKKRLSEQHKRSLSLALISYYETHDSPMKGKRHTDEAMAKMCLAKKIKPFTPWNKGLPAWNRHRTWPDEAKQNISQGMIVYYRRRQHRHHHLHNKI